MRLSTDSKNGIEFLYLLTVRIILHVCIFLSIIFNIWSMFSIYNSSFKLNVRNLSTSDIKILEGYLHVIMIFVLIILFLYLMFRIIKPKSIDYDDGIYAVKYTEAYMPSDKETILFVVYFVSLFFVLFDSVLHFTACFFFLQKDNNFTYVTYLFVTCLCSWFSHYIINLFVRLAKYDVYD